MLPDTFVFNGERRLVYRGQLDDSRPRNDLPVTAVDVRAAVGAVLAGRPVDPDQRPNRVRNQVALSRAHADGTRARPTLGGAGVARTDPARIRVRTPLGRGSSNSSILRAATLLSSMPKARNDLNITGSRPAVSATMSHMRASRARVSRQDRGADPGDEVVQRC